MKNIYLQNLRNAIDRKDEDEIFSILSKSPDLNLINERLDIEVDSSYCAILEPNHNTFFLLKNVIKVTPLQYAALKQNYPMITYLIKLGADANLSSQSGTPLMILAKKIPLTQISEGVYSVNTDHLNHKYRYNLDYAQVKREAEHLLITKTTNLNIGQILKILYRAIEFNPELASDLLSRLYSGSDINPYFNYTKNDPALCIAAQYCPNLIDALIEKGFAINGSRLDEEPFYHILTKFHSHLLLLYLERDNDFDPNTPNPLNGDTLLHIAATKNSSKITKYLVDRGADVNISNNKHASPLSIAYHNKNLTILEILMCRGNADIHLTKGPKLTVFECMLYDMLAREHNKIIQFLVDQELDINVKDENGITPIFKLININSSLFYSIGRYFFNSGKISLEYVENLIENIEKTSPLFYQKYFVYLQESLKNKILAEKFVTVIFGNCDFNTFATILKNKKILKEPIINNTLIAKGGDYYFSDHYNDRILFLQKLNFPEKTIQQLLKPAILVKWWHQELRNSVQEWWNQELQEYLKEAINQGSAYTGWENVKDNCLSLIISFLDLIEFPHCSLINKKIASSYLDYIKHYKECVNLELAGLNYMFIEE